MAQLQRVAATHAQTLAATQKRESSDVANVPPARAWRLAVIGAALGARLQRPTLLHRLGGPVVLLGPFGDITQAAAALRSSDLDALLLHEPQLHEGWLAAMNVAAPAFAAVPKAVLYSFAAEPVCEALATAGAALLREPQPDAVVAQWLHGLSTMAAVTAMTAVAAQPAASKHAGSADATPPRRWDDAALAEFAGRSSTIACECPRHVAELLVQLSHFEAYSAECEHRNAADAELHAHLRHVAATSRARFEAALEHVALHEGLMLPASLPQNGAVVASNAKRTTTVSAARPSRRP